ncbi:MAG: type II secretion system protein [Burkholderiales bacterium]|nr:type II secretion system protein [Phycisphaerae bacterium]
MVKHRNASRNRRQAAFTLVELLITIGIIAVLISILIPAVNAVRVKAATTTTRNMLARLESGLQNYYAVYAAYPGPIRTADLKPYTLTTAPFQIMGAVVQYQDDAGPTQLGQVTSSENLYLGLTAGFRVTLDPASPGNFLRVYFDKASAENPDGPNALNPLKLRRAEPFLKVDKSETTYLTRSPLETGNPTGLWNGAGDSGFVGDSRIPEYLDKYSSPMPILYMRANKGSVGKPRVGTVAARFLDFTDGDFNTTPDSGVVYPCQYDPEMIQKTYANYRTWKSRTTGAQMPVYAGGNARPWPDTSSTPSEDAVGEVYRTDFPAEGELTAGNEAYFGNAAISTLQHKEPAKKDEYMLISAGPDGRYGTKDDITNFR